MDEDRRRDRMHEFDEWAASYDDSVCLRDGLPFAGYDQVLDRVVQLAAPEPDHRVLDLGIGTGNLALRIARAGCRITGGEFSAAMLAEAARKVPGASRLSTQQAESQCHKESSRNALIRHIPNRYPDSILA